MQHNRIERETVIDAPPERVWEVLTDAEHLGRWFGDAGAEIELRPGGRFVLHWDEHPTAHGRVERVEPPRFFSYRWIASFFPDARDPDEGNSTLVEFALSPEGDATRLQVTESGFSLLEASDAEREERFEDNRDGWRIKLGELTKYAQQAAAR